MVVFSLSSGNPEFKIGMTRSSMFGRTTFSYSQQTTYTSLSLALCRPHPLLINDILCKKQPSYLDQLSELVLNPVGHPGHGHCFLANLGRGHKVQFGAIPEANPIRKEKGERGEGERRREGVRRGVEERGGGEGEGRGKGEGEEREGGEGGGERGD